MTPYRPASPPSSPSGTTSPRSCSTDSHGLADEELLWEPAAEVWTVRLVDGQPDARRRVVAARRRGARRRARWHGRSGTLGAGSFTRADWLVGSHSMQDGDLVWPMTAAESVAFARAGLQAWRDGLA